MNDLTNSTSKLAMSIVEAIGGHDKIAHMFRDEDIDAWAQGENPTLVQLQELYAFASQNGVAVPDKPKELLEYELEKELDELMIGLSGKITQVGDPKYDGSKVEALKEDEVSTYDDVAEVEPFDIVAMENDEYAVPVEYDNVSTIAPDDSSEHIRNSSFEDETHITDVVSAEQSETDCKNNSCDTIESDLHDNETGSDGNAGDAESTAYDAYDDILEEIENMLSGSENDVSERQAKDKDDSEPIGDIDVLEEHDRDLEDANGNSDADVEEARSNDHLENVPKLFVEHIEGFTEHDEREFEEGLKKLGYQLP